MALKGRGAEGSSVPGGLQAVVSGQSWCKAGARLLTDRPAQRGAEVQAYTLTLHLHPGSLSMRPDLSLTLISVPPPTPLHAPPAL